jgi:CarD family transcriptional regulator
MPRPTRNTSAARSLSHAKSHGKNGASSATPAKSNGKRTTKAAAAARPPRASNGANGANGASGANGTAHGKPRAPVASASVAPAAPAPVSASSPPAAPTPSSPPPRPSSFPPSSHRPGFPYVTQAPPPGPNVTFKVGDKAVHPAHGVGEVTAIEQREIGGTRATFYILRILDNAMKVMVPMGVASQVGLRGIMSDKEANNILATMRAREVAVDVQPWSRRFRVYTEMIKSGAPIEIAKVLRDMNRLKFDKDLSFGERRLLDQARSLLLKELAFAKKKTEAEMAEEIARIFSA